MAWVNPERFPPHTPQGVPLPLCPADAAGYPRGYDQSMDPRRNPAHGWYRGGGYRGEWHAPWWDPELEARRMRSRSSSSFRLLAPVIVSLLIQVPSVFVHFVPQSRPTFTTWSSPWAAALDIGIALIGPVALLFARRWPGPVVAIVGLAASADLLLAGADDGPPYIAFAFAIGSAIVRGARVWAWATIAVSWVGTLVVAGTLGFQWQPWRVVGISFGILVITVMAEGMRTRRENIKEATRRVVARRQSEVQAERVRIARELHDVLAHSLSQINVQAGVGLHLIDKQPEKAADALASIKETSKTALDEVRSVLGILRSEGGRDAPLVPEPDLSRLEGLAASVTAQGVEVHLDNELAEVPKATQLALYRIVQESLTNVLRHANATQVEVRLAEKDGSYLVRVSDNGGGVSDAKPSDGRGLLGMRERAELLGGHLEAGPTKKGFDVTATIPAGVSA